MAKQLPPAVFQCSNIGAKPVKAYTCEGAAESDCHSNKECSWCKSGAVPPACKNKEDAKKLPSAIFQCDNLDFFKLKSSCEGVSENACHANKACSWCKSAAVPAACKDKDMAKKLPAAVFQCDNLDFFKMKDSDCESFSSENTCNANKCSWCKSAAVKAACRDP